MSEHEPSNGKATRVSVISIGLAAALLVGAIETTWRMASGLADMRVDQSVGFGKIDGQIQLLKYQLEQQAAQISDIRTSIGQHATGAR